MPLDPSGDRLRIGELSRRVGVSDHVLRAWERRYGVLRPVRSPAGYRLYSAADESRIRCMQAHLARGLSAVEAARAALREEPARPAEAAPGQEAPLSGSEAVPPRRPGLADPAAALARSLDCFDELGAHAALDRLLADFTIESVLRDVVLPYLRDLGDRWARGQASIAVEHFASNVLRGRLAGLARGWDVGQGPLALLACPPGEQHDLPLLVFGIVLNRSGWRVRFIGADTPLDDLARTVGPAHPDVVVLAAARPQRFAGLTEELCRLAAAAPLVVAGAGATPELALATGARLLTGDPVTEAQRMSHGRSSGTSNGSGQRTRRRATTR